jgi:branched-chain amino acid transport system substrate-binding protein
MTTAGEGSGDMTACRKASRKRSGRAGLAAARRGRRAVLLLGLALAASSLAGAAARAGEPVIAVVETVGSTHQPYGREIVAGVRAAVERLNAEGGVLGARVQIEVRSETCTRERAVAVAEEIVRLGPAVVIGHLCAGAAMAAAGVYAGAGLLLIAPGVRHPALTEGRGGGLVLRLAGREDRFAADTTRYIRIRHGAAGAAVVADRTRQARTIADGVAAELRRQGIAVRLEERIESGEKSYDEVARRVRASGAGVVFMPAQPIELGVLAAGLGRVGVAIPIVGSDILAVPAVVPVARAQPGRLVLMLPWTGLEARARGKADPAPANSPVDLQRDAARVRAEAAVEVWAAAARHAGATTGTAVGAAARSIATPTAAGLLRFDEHGDAMVPGYVPSGWQDGGWRPLAD